MSQDIVATIGFATPLAFVAFSRRRELRVRRALHAAEVERIELQRKSLEADLRGLQAQVAPAFLLDTLRQIGQLCDLDPVTGGRLLDELIVYLRAALPDLRATRSTLRKEFTLARAYLAILELQSPRRLAVDAHVDESVVDAVMPPMVLLPLLAGAAAVISDATVDPTTSSSHAGQKALRLDAGLATGNLQLEVTARGVGAGGLARAPIVEEIRARIHALYGEGASLDVTSQGAAAATASLTIPHERL